MLDTLAKERADKKEKSRRRRDDIATADRIAAENYYKLWSQSINEKVKETRGESSSSPVKPSRSRPRPVHKRSTA